MRNLACTVVTSAVSNLEDASHGGGNEGEDNGGLHLERWVCDTETGSRAWDELKI